MIKLLKRYSNVMSTDICKEIMFKYFEFVKRYIPDIDEYTLSELLRYTICKGLQLQSIGFNNFVNIYSNDCLKSLDPIFDKYNLKAQSEEYKKALLEACVHSIEMSRKKA